MSDFFDIMRRGAKEERREPFNPVKPEEKSRFELRRSSPRKPEKVSHYVPRGRGVVQRKSLNAPRFGASQATRQQLVPAAWRVDFTPRVLTIEPVDLNVWNNPNLHGIPDRRRRT